MIPQQSSRSLSSLSLRSVSKKFSSSSMATDTDLDTSKWRRRRVVSSFLCCGTPHTYDFRISTFKRSSKVRAYPGLWAACSGSVEASDSSPLRAALRELQEETGLRDAQLVRLRGGDGEEGSDEDEVKYQITDEKLQTVWGVWPFLWRVLGDDGKIETAPEQVQRRIVLNWENDEMRFVTMDEMDKMDTVDDLSRGIREYLDSDVSK